MNEIEDDSNLTTRDVNFILSSYSQSIDAILEDEEQFADQLKEYYAFGDALRSVLLYL